MAIMKIFTINSFLLLLFYGFSMVHSFSIHSKIDKAVSKVLLRSTWSNGQAVQDYQNFLTTGKQELELSVDMPSIFMVGDLTVEDTKYINIVKALMAMGIGNDDIVLTPGQPLPETMGDNPEYPIYVTMPPRQLGFFLDNMPESYKQRIDDFVFFSGGLEYGNIEDVLKERGYCRDTMTQVLISGLKATENQSIDQKVLLGTDAVGEDKLAGECTACGKWAGSIASRLDRGNVFCRTEFYREWRRKMWERSIYDAVFTLVGAVRPDPTMMSDVSTYYSEEVSEIVWQMSQLLRGWRAITLTFGFEERLLGVGDFTGSDQRCELLDDMYPFVWGCSVFLESSKFVEYLQYAKNEMGLLQGITLPHSNRGDLPSQMRQGNLRADGVV